MKKRLDHLIPTRKDLDLSHKHMRDDFYTLPQYVEKFIEQVEPQLPEGWHVSPWSLNGCITIRNSNDLIMQVISYEGIQDGYTWKIEDVDRK